ncbi:nose resistant to fluoxetine protein 6-like [Drosophila montana]|uniref:nose resistant to fluoxetine protein 6-like n=1 Tax=Drosophila montana TaxID=40370 RepID=UPI00313E033A
MVKTLATLLNLLCALVLASAMGLDVELPQEYHIEPKEYQQLMKLQSLGVDFVRYFQNITMQDLDIPSTRLPSTEDLQCMADMSLWMKGLTSGSYWSLKMIDAWGSIPSGILYLNLVDIGNYGECIKISQDAIRGKYCLAELPFLSLLGVDSPIMRSSKLKIGICFPSSCTAAHMDTFLNQVVQQALGVTNTVQLVNENTCRTDEREPLDGLTILAIVLLSIFAGLALLATLYDYFLCHDQTRLPSVIRVFSIRATSRALFRITQPKSNPNVIDCLHGMRCMSLIWVVFGHEYMFGMVAPNINHGSLIHWIERPFARLIIQAVFAVDTFFFLSGLLVVMIALRSMERTKGWLNVPLMYLHRYLRLTPLLAMAILVYMTMIPVLVDGPLNKGFDDYSKCSRTWYLTLLYVQNYATDDICLSHSWYLSVDMQMYLLSPILLFALYKWGKKAAIGAVVLIVLLTVWLFTVMMVKNISMFAKNAGNGPDGRMLYFGTHMHGTPWLIGGVFGYYLHANRGKSFKLSRVAVWTGWIAALAILFLCEFVLLPYVEWTGPDLSQLSDALYYSLTRIAWPIGLCWVVFACMQGYGGMANSFLSSPLWQPLSKLSYSAYVWHIMIQEINGRRTQTSTYFSNYEMMLKFWADFGFTVLTAYFMYIIIEAPLGGLESLMLPVRRPSPKAAISAESKQAAIVEPAPQLNEKAPIPQLASDLEAGPAVSTSAPPAST